MKKILLRVGMVAGLLLAIGMLVSFFAVEQGVFEKEPIGVIELRAQKESGEKAWLPGQVAWLKIDGTHINYPVMQASDNTWYLSHDYYGNDVSSGAIFLDYRNTADFSDRLSIVYGHRMNGELMFSDVAKYRDSGYLTTHAAGVLELPDHASAFSVIAYYEISADDELYRNLSFANYDDPIIVLSTCDRANHAKRDILVLAFDNRGELW